MSADLQDSGRVYNPYDNSNVRQTGRFGAPPPQDTRPRYNFEGHNPQPPRHVSPPFAHPPPPPIGYNNMGDNIPNPYEKRGADAYASQSKEPKSQFKFSHMDMSDIDISGTRPVHENFFSDEIDLSDAQRNDSPTSCTTSGSENSMANSSAVENLGINGNRMENPAAISNIRITNPSPIDSGRMANPPPIDSSRMANPTAVDKSRMDSSMSSARRSTESPNHETRAPNATARDNLKSE